MLRGASTAEAAQAGRVSRATVSAWLNHDAIFSATLKRLKTEMLESTAAALRAEGLESVRVLAGIRDNEAEPAAVRMRAATELLRVSGVDARVEWPVNYTIDEDAATVAMSTRMQSHLDVLRKLHNEEVLSGIEKSPQGKRLAALRARCERDEFELQQLHSRWKRLSEVWAKVPHREAEGEPGYQRWNELEQRIADIRGPHERRLQELEKLLHEQELAKNQLVDDPQELVQDLKKLERLIRTAGLEWVMKRVHAIGRVEGVANRLTREYEREREARVVEEARVRAKQINPFMDENEREAGSDPL